ncbi:hypothetical protein QC762_121473 [Podospora pseudocomata]|uniref:Uncharacterized protein n=1 Tax=Podospora pseudocomata TaxID=2093779 RepID=A0ABR0GYM9_9PEZI|nr:hypothetical protein QC762_121473 [Podospora pseudocomata]
MSDTNEPTLICPEPPAKEGEVIIAGRPWRKTETTLFDTEGGQQDSSTPEGAELICPEPPAKEGEVIIAGRPWCKTETTLFDTEGDGKDAVDDVQPTLRCEDTSNIEEGKVIIAGKPWDQSEDMLFDTAGEGGEADTGKQDV